MPETLRIRPILQEAVGTGQEKRPFELDIHQLVKLRSLVSAKGVEPIPALFSK